MHTKSSRSIIASNAVQGHTISRHPVVFASGRGCRLMDVEGKSYLDLFSGHAVMNAGYKHPQVEAAMQQQFGALVHTGNLFHLPAQIRLAEALVEHSFGDRVYYANSGAEVVELAIKMVRRFRRRRDPDAAVSIICMEQSFHGRSYGALSATGQKKYKRDMGPFLEGFVHVPYNDTQAVIDALSTDTGAVLVEPVLGDGGIIPARQEYLESLRRLCTERDMLLIFDEVQTGLGRTGYGFACEHYGIEPDIMLLGKPLGGGLPLSALVCREEVSSVLGPGDHGSTFGGNPVAAAGGHALLQLIHTPGFLESVQAKGHYFRRALEKIREGCPECILDIRGLGLMLGMELKHGAAAMVGMALEEGLIINNPIGEVLRFVPPLIITEAEIDEACAILARVISAYLRQAD